VNPVELKNLPAGTKVYNFLYRSDDPDYLVRDLLTIELPNGMCIDVGWHPEHDPSGEYVVRAFYKDWQNQIFSEPVRFVDLDQMLVAVHHYVQRFSQCRSQTLGATSDEDSQAQPPSIMV